MSVIRDLTDEELEHAAFLARRWDFLCHGHSLFGLNCIELAKNRVLSRSQYETLKIGPRITSQKRRPPSIRARQSRRSTKRPITLPSIEVSK